MHFVYYLYIEKRRSSLDTFCNILFKLLLPLLLFFFFFFVFLFYFTNTNHHYHLLLLSIVLYCMIIDCSTKHKIISNTNILDARFRKPPIGGFKHVECLCGTLWILSLEKTWFFQLCMIASTLFWSNSMDTFNGPIVLRIHF